MVVEAAAAVVVVGEERRREALEARWKGSSGERERDSTSALCTRYQKAE